MRSHFMKPPLRALVALIVAGCCTLPKFNVGDMDGRLAFSGHLAFRFDFDAHMKFNFDGDFAGWSGLSAATAVSLGIDWSGKVAYAQKRDIDIDDDGVKESVSVIGFGEGDPDDVETVVATWKGDVYTFDDGYCYVLVSKANTVTLLSGRCDEQGPVLTCTSPADDLQDVSCEVCDEAGRCSKCDGTTVDECISDGSKQLDRLPEPEPESEPPAQSDAGADAAEVDASVPEPVARDAGAPTMAEPDASIEPDASPMPAPDASPMPEPDPTQSAAYRTCMDQLSVIEASVSLCGLALKLEGSELCSGHLSAVKACYSSIDGLSLLDSPCGTLKSDDCSEVVK
jgi:hypothetical protein